MPSRKLVLALLASAGLALFLGACKPTCTVEELQAPINLDPDSELAVIDPYNLVPFTWGYPVSDCEPDFFEMYLWTGLEPESPGMTGRTPYHEEISTGSWRMTWPIYLVPGHTYYWRQAACLEAGPGEDPCGPSSVGHFFTGQVCDASDEMQPVNLISPADNAHFATTDDITFAWDDPTGCLVSYVFWLQISEDPEFNEYLRRIPVLQSVWTVPGEEIPLEECHTYYWRVKTDPAGPPEDPFSEVRSFSVLASSGIACPLDLSEIPSLATLVPEVPIVTLEPVVTVPPIVPAEPELTAPKDTNCRAGPSTQYQVDDTLFAGVTAPIRGRNADATWLQILSPNLRRLCWVWGGQAGLQIAGDVSLLPLVYVAPLEPTEVPIVCSGFKTKDACEAYSSACKWEQAFSAVNVGKCVER